MKSNILVVEDEKDICDLLSLHLKREGHEVTTVENGEDALRLLGQQRYDLGILDWMLPGLSGLELCKKMRSEPDLMALKTPIFMVTARAHTSDVVLGLEMGADDYITKPFEIPVFLARVRALLRRSAAPSQESERKFEIGELKLDAETYEVTCGKREVQLTPSEFKLLTALVKNRGRVLTRERLIDLVQGEGVTVVDRTIDTHIF
jgi:two-component system, OmpR family, phosphate regulon response regulator PhoB